MFQKARQSRTFQNVTEQIEEAILSGKLKVGDQLPSERVLKEEFNISRGTLREGLRVLEQKGLIEIKTGVNGGCIVKAIGAEKISESLTLLIRYKKVSLQDLSEFRIGVEGDICSLAAQRVTANDVKKLKTLLAKLAAACNEGTDWDSFNHIHEQIHLTIAETTHNLLYISVLQMIFSNIHTYFDTFLPKGRKSLMKEELQDSMDLIGHIENRRGDEARRVVREHIQRFNRHMQRGQGTIHPSGV